MSEKQHSNVTQKVTSVESEILMNVKINDRQNTRATTTSSVEKNVPQRRQDGQRHLRWLQHYAQRRKESCQNGEGRQ